MSGFLCTPDDMHPYECSGPGKCVHCDQRDTSSHDPNTCALCDPVGSREPTDDEIYNRAGVEGGISYPMGDGPGSLGEHDWRL